MGISETILAMCLNLVPTSCPTPDIRSLGEEITEDECKRVFPSTYAGCQKFTNQPCVVLFLKTEKEKDFRVLCGPEKTEI